MSDVRFHYFFPDYMYKTQSWSLCFSWCNLINRIWVDFRSGICGGPLISSPLSGPGLVWEILEREREKKTPLAWQSWPQTLQEKLYSFPFPSPCCLRPLLSPKRKFLSRSETVGTNSREWEKEGKRKWSGFNFSWSVFMERTTTQNKSQWHHCVLRLCHVILPSQSVLSLGSA